MLRRYRATGADLPFGDPLRAHGTALEGYFWRLTDPGSGRVVVALCGVHRDGEGRSWSNVALAAHPGRVLHQADVPGGLADPDDLGVRAGAGTFHGDERGVRVDLGPRARLDLHIHEACAWPTGRALGGLGIGQVVPGLSQRWHPYLLGARATGTAQLDGERIDLDGFRVYAEKNWGTSGFPSRWWWGQAQHVDGRPDACVAFAGGAISLGPWRTHATAIVVRVGDRVVRLGDPVRSPVRTDFATDGRWRLWARSRRLTVELDGRADPAGAHLLPVPLPARRCSVPGARQHFDGQLHVTVRERGRLLLEGRSPLAGLEHGGAHVMAEVSRAAAATAPGGRPAGCLPAGRGRRAA
ncbi:tocopherol cyclase family protein [Paraconexibacter algicola]|uniref:Tocopherol cyclase n=1 Tax=Paraconexibacter algicola TaxID=2133960 RepID=A0A2T4UG36_9ACTN|nr:tocopherol cyclase family protein [Paraconexibacter algicola]PTL58190.1 hypothetical protein C7Y72_00250 [Paraconexibacter algicola]